MVEAGSRWVGVGAVAVEVTGCPGEGKQGSQHLILIDGLLSRLHGAPPRPRRDPIP
jgi:hypothetical protein